MHFKQNQIILNNLKWPKFEKSVKGHKKKYTKATTGRKKVWSEEIFVNCDVIYGADVKMV